MNTLYVAAAVNINKIIDDLEEAANKLIKENLDAFSPFYDYLVKNASTKEQLDKIKPEDLPRLKMLEEVNTRVILYSELYGKLSEQLAPRASLKYAAAGTFKVEYDKPFTEAADYFSGLGIVSPNDYYADLEKYAGAAFTISQIYNAETLADIKNYIGNQLQTGKVNPGKIKKAIKGFLLANGDDPLSPGHISTIVRTNLNTAFSKGRYLKQLEATNSYWQYVATIDGRETPLCYSLDMKIFTRDDPFWNQYYPPNHFNCRSTVISVTKDEALSNPDFHKGEKYLKEIRQKYPKLAKYIRPGKGFNVSPDKGLQKWLKNKAEEHGIPVQKSLNPILKDSNERREIIKEQIRLAKGLNKLEKEGQDAVIDYFSKMPEKMVDFIYNNISLEQLRSLSFSQGTRSYFHPGDKRIEVGKYYADANTIAHEFGHFLDFNVPGGINITTMHKMLSSKLVQKAGFNINNPRSNVNKINLRGKSYGKLQALYDKSTIYERNEYASMIDITIKDIIGTLTAGYHAESSGHPLDYYGKFFGDGNFSEIYAGLTELKYIKEAHPEAAEYMSVAIDYLNEIGLWDNFNDF